MCRSLVPRWGPRPPLAAWFLVGDQGHSSNAAKPQPHSSLTSHTFPLWVSFFLSSTRFTFMALPRPFFTLFGGRTQSASLFFPRTPCSGASGVHICRDNGGVDVTVDHDPLRVACGAAHTFCLNFVSSPKGADKGASETRQGGRKGEVQRGVLGLVPQAPFVLALGRLARDCGTGRA